MFCPECGKQNKDSSHFCAECGAALIDNQPGFADVRSHASFGEVFSQKIKPFVQKHKLKIIIVAGVLVTVMVFAGVGSSFSSPEHVVDGYLKSMKSSNFSQAYQYLDLEESEFVNKDCYAAYAKSTGGDFSTIKKYSIEEYDDDQRYSYDDEIWGYLGGKKSLFGRLFKIFSKREKNKSSDSTDDAVKWYNVTITLKDSPEEGNFRLKVVKQDKKHWLFFPSYKIDAGNMVASFSLSAVEGAEVKLDGRKLTKSDETDRYGMAQYEVARIFKGSHTLGASMHDCVDYEKEIVVSDYDRSFAIDSLEIKPELKEKLDASAKEIVKEFFLGAYDNKSFDSLNLSVTSNESAAQDLKEMYDNIVDNTHGDDDTGYRNLSFKSFDSETTQDSLGSENLFYSRITFKYSYTRRYKSYFTDEISEYDYDNQSGYATVGFTYENGQWLLWCISKYNI